jgi:hypothetical protein
MRNARFRPHHIFCYAFLNAEFPDRGVEFVRVEQSIKDIIQTDDETLVEAIEGIDELCRACPNCRDGRCESPQGDEEAVRKLDNILLKSLGISYGETRTPREWRMLIEQKAPLDFCLKRCPAKLGCTFSHPLWARTP